MATYLFLDESGDFNFSTKGTKYYVLSVVATQRPFDLYHNLIETRYDLVEAGFDLEEFHAAQDKQAIRDQVFADIATQLQRLKIYSIIIEKSKTNPTIREPRVFYPKMLAILMAYVFNGMKAQEEIVVFTDEIPVNKKRGLVEGTIKSELKQRTKDGMNYRVLHHCSKSNLGIQIADYCNWAIYRKWSRGDLRSYDLIEDSVKSEFEVFRNGEFTYY